jgi:hypothetical protein
MCLTTFKRFAEVEMDEEEVANVLYEVRVSDISVDEEGRVVIDNPEVAERMKAAASKKPKPAPVNLNCVKGCHGGATNTVPNCGCIILTK